MSTGQVFLTLGAIALLSYITLNISRTYITSVKEAVQIQREIEIINYGQSLSELMYSQSTNYDNFHVQYGNLSDINSPGSRLSYGTQSGDSLYATIDISPEEVILLDEMGRIATVTIFEQEESNFIQKARFFTAITPM
ncbi:MAG: hypothetical protein WEA56_12470 [Balneolaceae bacterium]